MLQKRREEREQDPEKRMKARMKLKNIKDKMARIPTPKDIVIR